ncbi:MAG: hypothetical protein H6650_06740 [Ardenticatenales bacterium]|nr:hypothetical protein [Ardenticatenales bacterium]
MQTGYHDGLTVIVAEEPIAVFVPAFYQLFAEQVNELARRHGAGVGVL